MSDCDGIIHPICGWIFLLPVSRICIKKCLFCIFTAVFLHVMMQKTGSRKEVSL